MELLCEVCDGSTIENQSEPNHYLATMRKKYVKSFYENYVIKKVNLDEVDEILNNHVYSHNKKFDFYIIYCDCLIEFDNKFT